MKPTPLTLAVCSLLAFLAGAIVHRCPAPPAPPAHSCPEPRVEVHYHVRAEGGGAQASLQAPLTLSSRPSYPSSVTWGSQVGVSPEVPADIESGQLLIFSGDGAESQLTRWHWCRLHGQFCGHSWEGR